jgi:hypothetical protein
MSFLPSYLYISVDFSSHFYRSKVCHKWEARAWLEEEMRSADHGDDKGNTSVRCICRYPGMYTTLHCEYLLNSP